MYEKKKNLIRESTDAESIFQDPITDYLYSDNELRAAASGFSFVGDLTGIRLVNRSHLVKAAFIEHLGYPRPTKFRGTGRNSKPKFRAQLMDIFVQSSTNLQVWNYIPYSSQRVKPPLPAPLEQVTFTDCRYVIISVRNDIVGQTRVVKGSELAQYDTTKRRTIKYQATIPGYMFKESGIEVVSEVQNRTRRFVDGKWDANEVRRRLKPILGTELPLGSERQVGEIFHKSVSTAFGSDAHKLNDGQFPDLPEFSTEVKFHMREVIDLGMVIPSSNEESSPGVIPSQITYVIGFGKEAINSIVVFYIVVLLGRDFEERFHIWPTQNFKVQIPIPSSWFT